MNLDLARAREIASWWHGGQSSALYAFTSTGTILPGLAAEIRQCRAEMFAHPGLYVREDIRNLRDLTEYVEAHWPMCGAHLEES